VWQEAVCVGARNLGNPVMRNVKKTCASTRKRSFSKNLVNTGGQTTMNGKKTLLFEGLGGKYKTSWPSPGNPEWALITEKTLVGIHESSITP